LTSDLHGVGYTNQTSIDFSSTVISQMRSQHPESRWRVMDVRDMRKAIDSNGSSQNEEGFADSSFDIAIDKATLDAMLYGSLWDPSDEVRDNVKRYVDEVARVLKPGGVWLYITWRQPHFIRPLLTRESVWTLECETLAEEPGGGGMFEYVGFVMRKVVGSGRENQ
jgi:EEF1A lysine methyltransferase 4